jgi:hypothetical protein
MTLRLESLYIVRNIRLNADIILFIALDYFDLGPHSSQT